MDSLDALGRRDQRDQAHRGRARPLDGLDRRRRRVSGREHRVEQDHVALGDVVRELDVVLDGLERLLVAVEADEPDPRARDEGEHAVEHPDARAQDRAHGHLLAGDPRADICSSGVSISTSSSARSFVAS